MMEMRLLRRRADLRLLCDRCMRRSDGAAAGWMAHLRPGRLGVYCPTCAPKRLEEYTEPVETVDLGTGVAGLSAVDTRVQSSLVG